MGTSLWGAMLWNADLSGAKHLKRRNFNDPQTRTPGRPDTRSRVSEANAMVACDTYRNLKHYFYGIGLYDDASWAAYKERTSERAHFRQIRSFRYLPSLLMGLLSGYTERPARVIVSSLFIIFLFAAAYYILNIPESVVTPSEHVGLWDCVYFSFITFTTVGFGDLVPHAHVGHRLLTALEAFTGPFMAGLYVFTLTRRYATS
jgi:hypothetical protein